MCIVFTNQQTKPPTRNLPKRNRRGGACVPARTSAQRRFHTKIYLRITHHARGFNDGCALAGRHGRAHRHRPYPSPSYTFLHHSIKRHHPSTCNPPMINGHFSRISTKTIHHLEMNERTDAASIIMPSGTLADNIRLLYSVIVQDGGLITRPTTTREHHF